MADGLSSYFDGDVDTGLKSTKGLKPNESDVEPNRRNVTFAAHEPHSPDDVNFVESQSLPSPTGRKTSWEDHYLRSGNAMSPPPRLGDLQGLTVTVVQGLANIKKTPTSSIMKRARQLTPYEGELSKDPAFGYGAMQERETGLQVPLLRRQQTPKVLDKGQSGSESGSESGWSCNMSTLKWIVLLAVVFAIAFVTGLLSYLAGESVANANETNEAMSKMGSSPGVTRLRLQEAVFRVNVALAYLYQTNKNKPWQDFQEFVLALADLYRFAGLDGQCVDDYTAFTQVTQSINGTSFFSQTEDSKQAWLYSLVRAMSCGYDSDLMISTGRERREALRLYNNGLLNGRYPPDLDVVMRAEDEDLPNNFPVSMQNAGNLRNKKQLLLQIWRLTRSYIDSPAKLSELPQLRSDHDLSLYVPFTDGLLGTKHTTNNEVRVLSPTYYDSSLWIILHTLAERVHRVQLDAKLESSNQALALLVQCFKRFFQAVVRVQHPLDSSFTRLNLYVNRMEAGVILSPPKATNLEWLFLAGSDKLPGARTAKIVDGRTAVLFVWKLQNAMAADTETCTLTEKRDLETNPQFRCAFWPYSARYMYWTESTAQWESYRGLASRALTDMLECDDPVLREYWSQLTYVTGYEGDTQQPARFFVKLRALQVVLLQLDDAFNASGVSTAHYGIREDDPAADNAYCMS